MLAGWLVEPSKLPEDSEPVSQQHFITPVRPAKQVTQPGRGEQLCPLHICPVDISSPWHALTCAGPELAQPGTVGSTVSSETTEGIQIPRHFTRLGLCSLGLQGC